MLEFLFARPELMANIPWWQPWLGGALLNIALLGVAYVLPKKRSEERRVGKEC